MNVFIADDSSDIRKRLVDMVEEVPDMKVVGQAQDTPEAIYRIKRLHPDVVILDIRMPGQSGIEVLEEIKKNDRRAVIIMLTNFPEPQHKEKCLRIGASHFLDKANDFHLIPGLLSELNMASAN